MRLSESRQFIPMLEPADYEAGIDFDSVHMGRLHSLSVGLLFGAITGDAVLKVSTGATEGTKTTDIAFKYRFAGGDFKAASADILGDATAVASTGLTLTAATFDHRQIVIEIDADNLTDGQPWVTLSLSAAASVLLAAAQGVGVPRHASHTSPTVVK
jgi:hypothetical protein